MTINIMAIRSGNRETDIEYVYQLPYTERKTLCNILDMNDEWEVLGGEKMNFSVIELNEIKRVERSGNSPTDKLLMLWGRKNNSILQLYLLLYDMEHYQAMSVLQPFVPEECSLEKASIAERTLQEKMEKPQIKPPSSLLQHYKAKYLSTNHNLNQVAAANESSIVDSMKKKIPQQFFTKEQKSTFVWNPSKSSKNKEFGIKPKIVNQMPMSTASQNQANISMANDPANKDQDNGAVGNPTPVLCSNTAAESVSTTSLNESITCDIDLTRKESNKTTQSNISVNSTLSEYGVPKISYSALEEATFNWNKQYLLGRGGFGTVYKGTWINVDVAIKRINPASENGAPHLKDQNINQTLDELRYLQKFRHDNILQLYGYSYELEYPFCLVYQFMPNGSLEYRLQCKVVEGFGDKAPKSLSWYERFYIAKGVAAALEYLHTAVPDKPLIHGDVKSANILLDKNLEPKLGDFGLAREGPGSKYTSMQVSHIHGTGPYIPDEYLRSKKLSVKVDTYSFGIVLFEISTGERAYSHNTKKYLKDDILSCKDLNLMKDVKGGNDAFHVFELLLNIGKDCIHKKPKERPEMKIIFKNLKTFSIAFPKEDIKLYANDISVGSSSVSPLNFTWQDAFPCPSTSPSAFHLSRLPTSPRHHPSQLYSSIPGYLPLPNPIRSPVPRMISSIPMGHGWVPMPTSTGPVYPFNQNMHMSPNVQTDHTYGNTKNVKMPIPQNEVVDSNQPSIEQPLETIIPHLSRLLLRQSVNNNLDPIQSVSTPSAQYSNPEEEMETTDTDLWNQSESGINSVQVFNPPLSMVPTVVNQRSSNTNDSVTAEQELEAPIPHLSRLLMRQSVNNNLDPTKSVSSSSVESSSNESSDPEEEMENNDANILKKSESDINSEQILNPSPMIPTVVSQRSSNSSSKASVTAVGKKSLF